jgi:tetratricopeptide (TPR) repeat protein
MQTTKNILDAKKLDCLTNQTGNFGFWYHLGEDYAKIGEAQEAIECYTQAIKFDALIFDTYSKIGQAYTRLGNANKAISYFEKSVTIQPQYGDGWYHLGVSSTQLSDIPTSLHYFKKSIDCIIPPSDDSFLKIGQYFLKANDLDNAYACLILALKTVTAKRDLDFKAHSLLTIGHVLFLGGSADLARVDYFDSMNCFGNYKTFIKKAELDTPDLIKIGLDLEKWRSLMAEIEQKNFTYFKILAYKTFNSFRSPLTKEPSFSKAIRT